jgi:hypothetical protein
MSENPPILYARLPDAASSAGYVVRGHTMGAIRDGWIVFIENKQRPPGDHLLNELCVVETKAGENLIRYVRKGRRPGTWDLVTVTGPDMRDVPVVWAELVILIQPHSLSGPEIEVLNQMDGVLG